MPNAPLCAATESLAAGRKRRRRDYMREWYRVNKESNRRKFKAWAASNREKRRATNRKYYWAHRDRVLLANRTYFEKHREKIRANSQIYQLNHKNEKRTYSKLYQPAHYQRNKHRLIAQTKAYAQLHPEVRRRCHRNYVKRHPDRHRAACSRAHAIRRSRLKNARTNCPNVVPKKDSGVIGARSISVLRASTLTT